jgi:hypothetical protein
VRDGGLEQRPRPHHVEDRERGHDLAAPDDPQHDEVVRRLLRQEVEAVEPDHEVVAVVRDVQRAVPAGMAHVLAAPVQR